jgi:hypothetical protein
MEQLSPQILRELTTLRGLEPTAKATKQQLLTLLGQHYKDGPFGVDTRNALYQQVLELRLIPRHLLFKELEKRGQLVEKAIDTGDLIMRLLNRQMDTQTEEALRYFTLPISQLQLLTGSSDINRVRLITLLVDPNTAGRTLTVSANVSELSRYGVRPIPVVPRILKPLTRDPKTLSPNDLLMAVQGGYDLSALLPTPTPIPFGTLQNIEQALNNLGVRQNSTVTSLNDKYYALASALIEYSKYELAPWWSQMKDVVIKMFPKQRRVALDQLGLARPNENLTDDEVLFRLSHGGAAPSLQKTSDRVAAVIAQRPNSRMIPILQMLDSLPDDILRLSAARVGIRLPAGAGGERDMETARDTLYRTIFLYEWITPDRPVLATVLPTATTSAELLAILRKYDDFELMSVWPGFGSPPNDRRELLQQLLVQLPQEHVSVFAGCQGQLGRGAYVPFRGNCWASESETALTAEINEAISKWSRAQLVQLSRALHRFGRGTPSAVVGEDNVVASLIAEVLPTEVGVSQPEELRTFLETLFEVGMIAMGWDGQSAYPLEQGEPNRYLLPFAQESLTNVAGLAPTEPSLVFDDNAMPKTTDRTMVGLTTLALTDDVVANAREIVQSSYIYLLMWYGARMIPFNPFVF